MTCKFPIRAFCACAVQERTEVLGQHQPGPALPLFPAPPERVWPWGVGRRRGRRLGAAGEGGALTPLSVQQRGYVLRGDAVAVLHEQGVL